MDTSLAARLRSMIQVEFGMLLPTVAERAAAEALRWVEERLLGEAISLATRLREAILAHGPYVSSHPCNDACAAQAYNDVILRWMEERLGREA